MSFPFILLMSITLTLIIWGAPRVWPKIQERLKNLKTPNWPVQDVSVMPKSLFATPKKIRLPDGTKIEHKEDGWVEFKSKKSFSVSFIPGQSIVVKKPTGGTAVFSYNELFEKKSEEKNGIVCEFLNHPEGQPFGVYTLQDADPQNQTQMLTLHPNGSIVIIKPGKSVTSVAPNGAMVVDIHTRIPIIQGDQEVGAHQEGDYLITTPDQSRLTVRVDGTVTVKDADGSVFDLNDDGTMSYKSSPITGHVHKQTVSMDQVIKQKSTKLGDAKITSRDSLSFDLSLPSGLRVLIGENGLGYYNITCVTKSYVLRVSDQPTIRMEMMVSGTA